LAEKYLDIWAEELAEKYLDIWEEADRQGDPLTRVDDALATLAREYHDLKKQFADTRSSPEDTPLVLRRRPGRERPTTVPAEKLPGAIHRPCWLFRGASPSTDHRRPFAISVDGPLQGVPIMANSTIEEHLTLGRTPLVNPPSSLGIDCPFWSD
jgi:hypothetical protein